jgi:hypothetical protein
VESAYHTDEFPATINEVGLDLLLVSVVLERVRWKGANTFRPAKFWNDDFNKGLPKRFAIIIEVPALYTKELLLQLARLFLARIKYHASRFFSAETSYIDVGVWLKEHRKQIIRDLTVL